MFLDALLDILREVGILKPFGILGVLREHRLSSRGEVRHLITTQPALFSHDKDQFIQNVSLELKMESSP